MSYKPPRLYDTPILLAALPDGVGSPIQGKLKFLEAVYCRELTVYHSRYWEAMASGVAVDILVELPLHRKVRRGNYANYKGHVYSIEQAQFEYDDDGLPITTLSLMRSEANYDIARS